MKRWTRKEMAVTLRSIPVRVGVAFYLVVLASGVAAGFADPELRSIRLELFRLVQVVLLALTVPWIVARLTERRGSEFVLELALTVSRGATALLAKAVALVVLVATLLTLSIPFAMIVFVSTTIPSGGVIAWYAGFLGFGATVALTSLHLGVNWDNPLLSLFVSWIVALGLAATYFQTFNPSGALLASGGWSMTAIILALCLWPRGNREFVFIDV